MSFTCDPYPLIFRSLFVMKSLRLWIVCFAPLLAAAEEFKVIATWPVRAAKDNSRGSLQTLNGAALGRR